MKLTLLLITIFLFSFSSISDDRIQEAPLEWLVSATIQNKMSDSDHAKSINDPLVTEIFKTIDYDPETDELIMNSSLSTNKLRAKLIDFLSEQIELESNQLKYEQWLSEKRPNNPVTLYRTSFAPKGFYFLNHIHTNLSKDNPKLKWLKYSPQKTFSMLNRFIYNRKTSAAVSFTDHDVTDAYDMVKNINYPRLNPMRSIEWGGKTHLGLVGVKENWDQVDNGRDYRGEESIIMSRTSDSFRIVNHPNRKNKPFPYTSWLDADGVEVWNSIIENSPFLIIKKIERSYNLDAFQQWVDSLKSGKSYSAVAGSDFHFTLPCLRDRSLFYPANYIPNAEKEDAEVLLKQGRVSFLTRPTAPKLTLQAKFKSNNLWSNMGDKINGNNTLQVQLFGDFSDVNKRIGGICYNTVRRFYRYLTFWKKRFWEVRFYNKDGQLIAKRSINPRRYRSNRHFKATIELDVQGKELIRAELWEVNRRSRNIDILGATNPIYLNW